MNIFVTSSCPYESAKFLDDKRVNKMLTESLQMLCTALDAWGACERYRATNIKTRKEHWVYYLRNTNTRVYAPSHANHPCNKWAREGQDNWFWLWNHAMGLAMEFEARFGKKQKGEALLHLILPFSGFIGKAPLTQQPNCSTYKDEDNLYVAYQLTLNDKWDTDKRTPTWHGRAA